MSKAYENQIANDIFWHTDAAVKAYRCGHSGNSAIPQPDVLVTDADGINHAMELKGPIRSDRCYVDGEDIEQLLDCQGPNTAAYLVIKFSYRQPVAVRFFDDVTNAPDAWSDASDGEKFAMLFPDCFEASVTDGGRLSLKRPSAADWSSARAGPDDHVAILGDLGIATTESVTE